jgi:hypothetical protein
VFHHGWRVRARATDEDCDGDEHGWCHGDEEKTKQVGEAALPHGHDIAKHGVQAELVVAPFAKDFRQLWDVASNNEASVDMVNSCLQGAYALGISQPQYRRWLPLAKIGETVAILHIMRCNLCLDKGDLEQAVYDAQAAVKLSTVPGTPQYSPKATSGMWFAQACRALGRVCVVRTLLHANLQDVCGRSGKCLPLRVLARHHSRRRTESQGGAVTNRLNCAEAGK